MPVAFSKKARISGGIQSPSRFRWRRVSWFGFSGGRNRTSYVDRLRSAGFESRGDERASQTYR